MLNTLGVLIQPGCAAGLLLPWMVGYPIPGLMEALPMLVIWINLDT